MSETLYFEGGLARVPSLEEITSLPGRIETLENQKTLKIVSYRDCVDNLESIFQKDDLYQALELSDRTDEMEREIDSLRCQIEQLQTELNALVTEKLTEARVLFKKMAGNGTRSLAETPVLRDAAEAIASAKGHHEGKDLTAALIKAHQALTLLTGLATDQVRDRLCHHRERAEML